MRHLKQRWLAAAFLSGTVVAAGAANGVPAKTATSSVHSSAGVDLAYLSIVQGGAAEIGYGLHGVATVTLSMTDPAKRVTIGRISLTNVVNATVTVTGNTCDGAVISGATFCVVTIDVYATSPYLMAANFNAATNEGSVSQSLTIPTPAKDLVYTPTSIDFGNQAYLTDSTRTILVTNPNPLPINLYSDGGFQDDALGFAPDYVGKCDSIPAGGTCQLYLKFAPLALGTSSGEWQVFLHPDNSFPQTEPIRFTGTGVQNATNVDLSRAYNVVATSLIGTFSGPEPVNLGGLDRFGNVYSDIKSDFLAAQPSQGPESFGWLRESFVIGPRNAPSAVANQTITVPAGNYQTVTLLGTAVFGPKLNQPFLVKYMDGSSATIVQNFSDWKTPKSFANESIAAVFPYRVQSDGVTLHTGPYYLFGYTLAVDATKRLASISLPPTRDVIVVAMNLLPTAVPVAVDLKPYFNVIAIRNDSSKIADPGIDGQGDALSYQQLHAALATVADVTYTPPAPNLPNAVAAATIALPAGQYSSLRLLGMGVNGARNRSVGVKYADGTTVALKQTFSDWHLVVDAPYNPAFSNGVVGESNGFASDYRLNSDGSEHAGYYMVYEYTLPLDSSKTPVSLQLPSDKNVVVLGLYLQR